MTNQVRVRKARLDDLDVLLSFEKGIIEAERPFDPTLKAGEIHYYDLKKMITEPHVVVVVAEYGAEIIGSGYARIDKAKPFLSYQQYAYLGFMYVHPEYRGKAVISKIVDSLKDWIALQGVTEIRLEVYCNNETAIKAYEKIGFSKLLLEMRLSL